MPSQNLVPKKKAEKLQSLQNTNALIQQDIAIKTAHANAMMAQERAAQEQQAANAPAHIESAVNNPFSPESFAPTEGASPSEAIAAHRMAESAAPLMPPQALPAIIVPPGQTIAAVQQPQPIQRAPIADTLAPDPMLAIAAMQDQISNLTKLMMLGQQNPVGQPQRVVNPTVPQPKPVTAGPKGMVDPLTGKFKEMEELFVEGAFGTGGVMLPAQIGQPVQVAQQPQQVIPNPPGTRQEYAMQHNPYLREQFPEVTDIFQNRIPNANPVHGVVGAVKPQALPPAQIVQHQVSWTPPQQELAYRVVADFGAYLGDVFKEYSRGDMLYEITEIDSLMQGGCSYIEPVTGSERFICCPKCQHRFPEVASGR